METSLKVTTYLVTKQTSTDKKFGITPSILSDHHGLKLEFNKTCCRKSTISWKLNSAQLNNPWVKEKIKKEIKDFLEFNKNEETSTQKYGTL